NRYPAFHRAIVGSMILAISFFMMAIDGLLPISIILFVIGLAKGLIYPAIAALLASLTPKSHYGRVFALLSIAYSIRAFIGPGFAGYIRDALSPYFFAFLILMIALSVMAFAKQAPHTPRDIFASNSSTFPGK